MPEGISVYQKVTQKLRLLVTSLIYFVFLFPVWLYCFLASNYTLHILHLLHIITIVYYILNQHYDNNLTNNIQILTSEFAKVMLIEKVPEPS